MHTTAARDFRLTRRSPRRRLLPAGLVWFIACSSPADPYRAGADGEPDAGSPVVANDAWPDEVDTTQDQNDGASPLVACVDTADCAVGTCVPLGDALVCAARCDEDGDCAAGWQCEDDRRLPFLSCACAAERGTAERWNDLDDDCDGHVDESLIRVAFWNVRSLSSTSRDADEIREIAQVMSQYDVVAVAEVDDTTVIASIVEVLGRGDVPWSGVTSARVGNSPSSSEHYGFVYREDRVALESSRVLPELTLASGAPFGREPFAGWFRAEALDFALLAVHVTWGSDEEARVDEIRALGPYAELVADEEPDVVVAGDLNRDADDSESLGWLAETYRLATTTRADVATKVDSPRTYSHILLSPASAEDYSGDHGVDMFDQWLYEGDAERASLRASDHRPVWVALRTDVDDD